jgi:hypothetical protein
MEPQDVRYTVTRKCKFGIKGKHQQFFLSEGNCPVLSSVWEGGAFRVFGASSCHASILSSDFTSFSLCIPDEFGSEVMRIRFHCPLVAHAPRIVSAVILESPLSGARNLRSKTPVLGMHGDWLLDSKRGIRCKSIKNCILCDDDSTEVLSVMKSQSDTLMAEAESGIDKLFVFALVISSFLCSI